MGYTVPVVFGLPPLRRCRCRDTGRPREGFDQLPRQAHILSRWCRVPQQVIVHEDQRPGALAQRGAQHLTRMHEGRRLRTRRHEVRQQVVILGVEQGHPKVFLVVVVVEKVKAETVATRGFDAESMEFVDMLQVGIIDPTKVERSALQNAASVASLLLMTEAVITDMPDEKPAGGGAPHMPHGDF